MNEWTYLLNSFGNFDFLNSLCTSCKQTKAISSLNSVFWYTHFRCCIKKNTRTNRAFSHGDCINGRREYLESVCLQVRFSSSNMRSSAIKTDKIECCSWVNENRYDKRTKWNKWRDTELNSIQLRRLSQVQCI